MMWFAHCRIVYGEPESSLPASVQSRPSSTVALSRCAPPPETPETSVARTADSRSFVVVDMSASRGFGAILPADRDIRELPARRELRSPARGLDQRYLVHM